MLHYAITDRKLLVGRSGAPDSERAGALDELVKACALVAQQGVDYLLVREKDLPAGELAALCRRILGVRRRTKVLVATRVDVAVAVGADGVHLSARDGELRAGQVHACFARAGLPTPFVSVACHEVHEVERARREGASAVLFGPVFGKVSGGVTVAAGTGLAYLERACAAAGTMPVLALGGVTEANAAHCMAAGAAGWAGIRMYFMQGLRKSRENV